MLSACAAIVALALMGSVGVALLRRLACVTGTLEQLAYGLPLGIVVSSLLLLALASALGRLPAGLVLIVAVAAGAGAAALGGPDPWRSLLRVRADRWSLFVVLLFGALTLRWVLLFRGSLPVGPAGLFAGQGNIWGDWAEHLGDVTSFAYGANFPPSHPRLAGLPFAYHYLTSITVAGMVALGMDPVAALPLHGFVFSILVALAVYAFARRLTGGSSAAALTVLLFLLGGGLGWTLQLRQLLHASHEGTAMLHQPWDAGGQQAANYRWLNVYFSLIYPQRSFLYGIPLGLLTLSLLMTAIADRSRRTLFVVAGVVAGLLPFAHLGTLLSLALITPFLFLLCPSAGWLAFFSSWVIVAVPQIWLQQGGGTGAAGATRLHWGWVSGSDGWAWFWLKNLGAFVPLLAIALGDRRLFGRIETRVLWASMPVFLVANLIVFQPWEWDNSKFLAYWFLAVCILVAALLVEMWRSSPTWPVRTFLVATILTMTLSGVLENVNQLLGRDRHLLLTPEEIGLARAVREKTDPHAIFAAGLQHNHPIPMLAGRRVIMSYPGWMWSQGADTREREHDLRRIMALAPDTRELTAKYRIDYVVIGPNEREKLGADLAAYQRTFPAVVTTENYSVFDVRASR